MKMIVGYAGAFIGMTVIASLMTAGILVFVVLLGSFVAWQLPLAAFEPDVIMLFLRICVGIGSVFGFFFLFAADAKQTAKETAELFWRKTDE